MPDEWRETFREIAAAFVAGDFTLREHGIGRVAPVDPDTARRIADNVAAYGEALAPLSEETWDRSVYVWTGSDWEFLVDLSTEGERVSDLTLHANVRDKEPHRLDIHLVYVP